MGWLAPHERRSGNSKSMLNSRPHHSDLNRISAIMTNYITINQLRAVNAYAMSTLQEEPATLQQRHHDLERFKHACISHDANGKIGFMNSFSKRGRKCGK
jgi:hypothetical protein